MVNENQKAKAVLPKALDVALGVILIVLGLLMFATALIVANAYAYRVSIFGYIGINIDLYIWFFVAMVLFIVSGVLVIVLKPIQKKLMLIVSDKRILARTLFKTVQLPLEKITAIRYGIFKHITVVAPRGHVTFYFISNIDEVVAAIEAQLYKN